VRRHSFRKFLASFIITITVCIVIAGSGYAAWQHFVRPPAIQERVEVIRHIPTERDVNDEPAFIVPDPEDAGLLLGAPPSVVVELMDRKPNFYTFLIYGLDEGYNTDTIMVGAFDNENGEAFLISIPRDTRVDVTRNHRKITTSYAAGRLHGRGHAGGIDQLKSEVQSLVGFRPDFYVSVDYQAFVMLVDSLGGVEVDVPFHMRNTHPDAGVHIDIPAGLQTLSGQQVLNFVRFRNADSGFRAITDYGRIENQQLVISTIVNELLHPSTIMRIPEFLRIYQDYITTDLIFREKLYFAEQLVSAGSNFSLYTYTLPIAGTSGAPRWYELPYRNGIIELVNRTVNPFEQDITADMLRIAS